MNPHRRRLLVNWSLALSSCATPLLLQAQTPWPQRPITLIVPFAAGGGTDIVARAIAARLSARLGQSVVVDNKPGAGTVIGAEAVARAEPNGYTLLVSGASTWSINPAMRGKLRYDALKDFVPIGIIARVPLLFLVNSESTYTSMPDFLKKAKASSSQLNFATHGPGTVPHLAGAQFQMATGIKMTDVAYRGSNPALMALLGKEIDIALDTAAVALPQIKAGKVRALANFGASRSPLLPELPTMAELGLPSATFDGWYGMAAPAGTPDPVIERLSKEIRAIMREAELMELLRAQSIDTADIAGPQMATQIEAEQARFRALAHRAQIRLD